MRPSPLRLVALLAPVLLALGCDAVIAEIGLPAAGGGLPVTVFVQSGVDPADVRIALDGQDVTGLFAPTPRGLGAELGSPPARASSVSGPASHRRHLAGGAAREPVLARGNRRLRGLQQRHARRGARARDPAGEPRPPRIAGALPGELSALGQHRIHAHGLERP